ncbi:MAG TPA: hypothetical protein EYM65_11055, partial [Dehalococcoidia bacterium]|nr:hypothetical protein [Dehalococcoidia bacterium]
MAPPDGHEEETPALYPPGAGHEQPEPAVLEEYLAWMKDSLEWGTKAKPGKHGMTMRAINVGLYGEVPEESRDMSRRPRGSFAIPGVPATDLFAVNRKEELWSDNAVDLYEEAV